MNRTVTAIIQIPKLSEYSSISFLPMNPQKMAAGTAIRNIVRKIDLMSGPKINLP